MSSLTGPTLDQQKAMLQGEAYQGPPSALTAHGRVASESSRIPQQEMQDLKPIPLNADMTSGIPWLKRLLQGVATTPQARMSYLFEEYGDDNVMSITPEARSEDIFVREWVPVSEEEWVKLGQVMPAEYFDFDDDGNYFVSKWIQVDPQRGGVDWKEPLDWFGDVAQSGPGMLGAKIGGATGGPSGALAGSLVGEFIGSVGRQAASSALPGEEDLTFEQRVGQTVSDVAMGAVGEGVGSVAGQAFDVARPHNVLARTLRRTDAPEYLQEGLELAGKGPGVPVPEQSYEQIAKEGGTPALLAQLTAEREARARTGRVNLSAGQITGGDLALRFEAMVRESPEAGDLVRSADVKRIIQLEDMLKDSIERFGGKLDSETAGNAIANTTLAYLENLQSARSKAADVLFGRVAELAGKGRVINANNTVQEITKIVNEHSGAFSKGSSTSDAIISRLRKMRDAIVQERQRDPSTGQWQEIKVSLNEFKKDLSRFSRMKHGDGTLVENIPKSEDMYLARRIYDALLRDLDATVERGNLRPEARDALVKARQAWARMSKVMDDTTNRVIKDTLSLDKDAAPERIAEKIAGSGWTNSQVRNGMRFLEKVDKRTANMARAFAIQNMMDKSPILAETMRGRAAIVSPAKLNTFMIKNAERLDALFFNSTERARLEAIRKTAGRIADASGMMGGSRTAPMLWMRRVFKELGGVIDPKAFASQVYTFMTTKRLAKALTSADGQRVVLDLYRLGEGKGDALRVAARLAAYNASEDTDPYFTPLETREFTREEIGERTMRFAPGGI